MSPLYVFSERSLYAIARRPVVCRSSVCLSVCLSVTLVRLIQPVEIFRNFSTPFGTVAIQ